MESRKPVGRLYACMGIVAIHAVENVYSNSLKWWINLPLLDPNGFSASRKVLNLGFSHIPINISNIL